MDSHVGAASLNNIRRDGRRFTVGAILIGTITRPQLRRPSVKDRIRHHVLNDPFSCVKIPVALPSLGIAQGTLQPWHRAILMVSTSLTGR